MSNLIKKVLTIIGIVTIATVLQYYTGTLDLNTANYIKGLIVGMVVAYE